MAAAAHNSEGMFIGSELGFSYHCKCGWTSDRLPTYEEAAKAALRHDGGQPTFRSLGFIRTDEGTKPHPHDRTRHGSDGELLPYHRACVEVFIMEAM